MAFGFRIENDDRIVQVDDSYPVMQLSERGIGRADTNIMFSKTYTSGEPPMLFVRAAQSGGYMLGGKFLGSPGAWTGFRLQGCSSQYFNHSLSGRNYGSWQYMVGEWAVRKSSERYGLRVWDEDGKLLYDAGVQHIDMEYQFQRWQYGHRHEADGWYYVVHYLDLPAAASLADPRNYLLANSLMAEYIQLPGTTRASSRKVGGLQSGRLIHVTQTNGKNIADMLHPGVIGRASL
jgi:hypothetical protein